MAPVHGEKLPTTHADLEVRVLPREAPGQQTKRGGMAKSTM